MCVGIESFKTESPPVLLSPKHFALHRTSLQYIDLNRYEYGLQNPRCFRALKVWLALQLMLS